MIGRVIYFNLFFLNVFLRLIIVHTATLNPKTSAERVRFDVYTGTIKWLTEIMCRLLRLVEVISANTRRLRNSYRLCAYVYRVRFGSMYYYYYLFSNCIGRVQNGPVVVSLHINARSTRARVFQSEV